MKRTFIRLKHCWTSETFISSFVIQSDVLIVISNLKTEDTVNWLIGVAHSKKELAKIRVTLIHGIVEP
jgi:hypothetical protein